MIQGKYALTKLSFMNRRFKVFPSELPDMYSLETISHIDERGIFQRKFCDKELDFFLGDSHISQINFSSTKNKGTIRGMHFQYPPFSEKKIIFCTRGSVFDVVIDLRAKSKTFLKWHTEILRQDNNRIILVPEGFAHGFQALENESELIYFHTKHFNEYSEGVINPINSNLNIQWPLKPSHISDRDLNGIEIDKKFNGISL